MIWLISYDIKNMLRTFLEDGFTFEFPFETVSDSLELELELVLDSPVLLALSFLAWAGFFFGAWGSSVLDESSLDDWTGLAGTAFFRKD